MFRPEAPPFFDSSDFILYLLFLKHIFWDFRMSIYEAPRFSPPHLVVWDFRHVTKITPPRVSPHGAYITWPLLQSKFFTVVNFLFATAFSCWFSLALLVRLPSLFFILFALIFFYFPYLRSYDCVDLFSACKLLVAKSWLRNSRPPMSSDEARFPKSWSQSTSLWDVLTREGCWIVEPKIFQQLRTRLS